MCMNCSRGDLECSTYFQCTHECNPKSRLFFIRISSGFSVAVRIPQWHVLELPPMYAYRLQLCTIDLVKHL